MMVKYQLMAVELYVYVSCLFQLAFAICLNTANKIIRLESFNYSQVSDQYVGGKSQSSFNFS